MGEHVLSWMTFFPLLGAAVIAFLPRERKTLIKYVAAAATAVPLLLGVQVFIGFDRGTAAMQMVEKAAWIPPFNIEYFMGIDGLSVPMVLLTALLSFICVIASWGIDKAPKGYFSLFLLLETGMMGVFCALDFFLFYMFWEVMLLPMYFLIGIWGGPRKEYAAIKFFLYTLAGSVLMLLAMLALYFNVKDPVTGGHTFNMLHMMNQANHSPWLLGGHVRHLVWMALFIGFAIKVPIFPFHTWLPDAHVAAPTGGSVILAAVLLKMGTYGFVRLCLPLFPEATIRFTPWIAALALIGILYGALVALVQKDAKSLVAYSSVAHLGFVMLGIFALNAQGIAGATLQMVNHGLSTGALFLMVGMLYNRRHTRQLADFGGLWKSMPIYGFLFLIVAMSSAGLPGLNGFVGEINILIGAFQTIRPFAILGTLGIILAAWYLLSAVRQMLHGPVDKPENAAIADLKRREVLVLVPLVILFFVIGLFPNIFFDKINPSAQAVADAVMQQRPAVSMAIEK
jgi:NADH-quinone oxidoreductase subunit M